MNGCILGSFILGVQQTRSLERRQEVKMRHKKGQMRGKELNTSFSLFCSLDKGFAESIFS